MGSVGPFPRARVCDLVNHEPDKPLPAPQRVRVSDSTSKNMKLISNNEVQQRGVEATAGLLAALLEGVELEGGRPISSGEIVVVDILPNRRGNVGVLSSWS